MAIKTRAELQAYFQNGMVPTAQHFKDLIDSLVNKKDDDFFGLWQPGVAYYDGDVVLFGKTLYMLRRSEPTEDPCTSDDAAKVKKNSDAAPAPVNDPYCNNVIPCKDGNWCPLEFDLQDNDWVVDETKGIIYVKNPVLNAGIGTEEPCAKLHVREEERGALMFNPADSPDGNNDGRLDTELRLVAMDYSDCFEAPHLSVRVDDEDVLAEAVTKNGFTFLHTDPTAPATSNSAQRTARTEDGGPFTLMSLTRAGDQALAGIGTRRPEAGLHVYTPAAGLLALQPVGAVAPTLQWLIPGMEAEEKQLTIQLDGQFARIDTNAGCGIRFDTGAVAKNGENPVVVIDPAAHLGVGTDEPGAHLEVLQPGKGAFQVCLEKTNPAVAILNLMPSGKTTFLTAGADNSYAVLKTDAPCGFVFRIPESENAKSPERNINEGTDLVFIDKQGNVGIGDTAKGFDLDVVEGSARSAEAYLATGRQHIHQIENIEAALETVCRLTPMRFKWRDNQDGKLSPDYQFGLYDYECADLVPEVVKITEDDEKSIAYQSLVPLLIRAIQEQQGLIDELSKRITRLENR